MCNALSNHISSQGFSADRRWDEQAWCCSFIQDSPSRSSAAGEKIISIEKMKAIHEQVNAEERERALQKCLAKKIGLIELTDDNTLDFQEEDNADWQ